MFINYLPYFAPVLGRQIETERLLHIEAFPVKPILAFGISLAAVHMNRLMAFIGVRKKLPSSAAELTRSAGLIRYEVLKCFKRLL